MRTKILHLAVGLLALLAGPHFAFAQGTAFTYQGQLTSGDLPANGSYDLAFSLYATASGGSPLAGPLTNSATAISNGLFTVTLDFGANFPGTARWLEISVQTNGGSGFATLNPRQTLTPTPYAIYAGGASAAGISGTLGAAQIPSLDANKIITGTFNAAQIPTLDAGTKLTGTLADAQLSANVALLNRAVQTFTGGNNSFSGNVGIGTNAPQAKLHLSGGNLKLSGGNVNLDSGQELFFADQGQIRSTDDHHRILFRRLENKLELREFGALIFSPGATSTNETAKVVMLANGNVGIGVTNPSALLHVNGGVNGASFTGNGAGLTGLAAANVTGVLAPAQIPSLDASQLATGTLADARLSANVTRLNANQTFTGTNIFTKAVAINAEVTANVVTITGGSDVAEPYQVANAGDIKPIAGMVVAIDSEQIGQMRVAARAYDKTVAGILSGANGISPGITLRQAGTVADGALPVASIGRVWCFCDADANGSIEAGDLLTTSDTPGHAMKVGDFDRANGSVIGKAMSSLKTGRGLVLVFVSLK